MLREELCENLKEKEAADRLEKEDKEPVVGRQNCYVDKFDELRMAEEMKRLHLYVVSEFITSTESDSPDSDVGNNNRKKKRVKKITNPDHLEWINSWHTGEEIVEEDEDTTYRVYTDVYFRKGRRGIGVIILDDDDNPIVASAVQASSTEVLSCPRRYQQLLGVTRGIELALECSIPQFDLYCNSKYVVRLVEEAVSSRGCDLHLPHLKKIAEMAQELDWPLCSLTKCQRIDNSIADYLSRNVAPAGMGEVLWPSQFPYGLQRCLCKEYLGN